MNKRPIGYFEADGSYNERPQKGENGLRKRSEKDLAWWASLSEGHRRVIIWYQNTYGQRMAHHRNIHTQQFADSKGIKGLKGPEQHDFAYINFEEFKQFCINKEKPNKKNE